MTSLPPRATRVLVVDDRPDNLIVLKQVISAYVPLCEVLTASSASEGFVIADDANLDGFVIDVQMPEMDGIEMCGRLKKSSSSAHVPVILITSHSADPAVKARGLEAGADDFVNRPVNNAELAARIKVILRIKAAEDDLRQMNAHLEGIVRDRTEKLQASMWEHAQLAKKIIQAQEEERSRVSRDLHDELGQILTALHIKVDSLRQQVLECSCETIADGLSAADEIATGAISELRRICHGLRPSLLDDLGLEAASRHLVEDFDERTLAKVDYDIQIDESDNRLPVEASLCTFRILQETLHNIERHADAKHVSITLLDEGGGALLKIGDDGCGFETNAGKPGAGWGIAGMRERASLVDGLFQINSTPGRGTQVYFQVPKPNGGSDD